MPDGLAAIERIQDWSRLNRKEIVNLSVEFVGSLPQDVIGAVLGSVPETRKPDYARLILQLIADQKPTDERRESADRPLKLAAKSEPAPKRPKR